VSRPGDCRVDSPPSPLASETLGHLIDRGNPSVSQEADSAQSSASAPHNGHATWHVGGRSIERVSDEELHAAWEELHAANDGLGWFVGRPGQRHSGQWERYAFDPKREGSHRPTQSRVDGSGSDRGRVRPRNGATSAGDRRGARAEIAPLGSDSVTAHAIHVGRVCPRLTNRKAN
jgi:hypothetical protein